MPSKPYIPHDTLSGGTPDADLAADIAELSALLSTDETFLLSDLRNDVEIGGDEYDDVDEQTRHRDLVVDSAERALTNRAKLLDDAYPFELDETGNQLSFIDADNWGKKAYLLSLVLSNLGSITDVLKEAELAPDAASIIHLRNWFQQMSAAALAAEVRGRAWAFGWPRPDHTNFDTKLKEIWREIGDGELHAEPPNDAPQSVKDCEIDVIAARPHLDRMPGFLLVMAQVATGANWRDKSVRNMVDHAFFDFWFSRKPASQRTAYHIIPFVLAKNESHFETLRLGHILSRSRFSALTLLAENLIADDAIQSEGTEAFESFGDWFGQYRDGDHFA
jgi:hypothetical protein